MTISIFIGFFGLARSLDHTIESIERNVFAPIEDAGIRLVRAAHLNCPDVIHSPRSGEDMIGYSAPDLGRLRLDAVKLEDQSDLAIASELDLAMSIPQNGEADPDGTMRRNAVHQMNSLRGLYRLFAAMNPESYSAVLILRPDLRYIDPFPIRKFLAQLDPQPKKDVGRFGHLAEAMRRGVNGRVDLITPGWHLWGGMNDRMAIATPNAAAAYMNRLDLLQDYAADHSHFQSEHLLKYACERAGLKTAKSWVRADRVRATGAVEGRDTERRENRLVSAIRPIRAAFQI